MATQVKTKTLDKLALDGGNAFLKWSYGSSIFIQPSWAIKIDYKQTLPEGTLQTDYFGQHWVFGAIAKDLGGRPLFDLGKEVMTPILLKAILESTGHAAINELSVLVPDDRHDKWTDSVQIDILGAVPVTSVRFIAEGIPPYEWAKRNNIWLRPDMQNGILDCGGGDLSLRMFTRSGVIDWGKSRTLPGTKAYAERIAKVIGSDCTYSPQAGDILSSIEDGTFEYIDGGRVINFKAVAESVRLEWLDKIKAVIRSHWQSEGARVGQVMLVGGGVHLMEDGMVAPNKPYFVPKDPQVGDSFPQMINALSMAQL